MGKRASSNKALSAKKSSSSIKPTGTSTAVNSFAHTNLSANDNAIPIPALEPFKVANANNSAAATTSSAPVVKVTHKHSSHNHQNFICAAIYSLVLFGFIYLAIAKGSLINDPVLAMTQSIPIIIAIQLWYCLSGGLDAEVICVHNHKISKDSSGSTSTVKKSKKSVTLQSSFSPAVLATILSLLMSVLVFGLLILFGAPTSSFVYETFLCAVHISILSVQPLVFVYNLDSNIWKDIISANLPLNGVYGASVGTWVGAWLGAIPIPLDWDRPWQQWPITILVGSYLGTAVGTLIGALYRKFRKSK